MTIIQALEVAGDLMEIGFAVQIMSNDNNEWRVIEMDSGDVYNTYLAEGEEDWPTPEQLANRASLQAKIIEMYPLPGDKE